MYICMHTCIYIYIYIYIHRERRLVVAARGKAVTANLRTKILDFRGFDLSRILIKGWNSHVHGGFLGKLESSNLSREILSREIGHR